MKARRKLNERRTFFMDYKRLSIWRVSARQALSLTATTSAAAGEATVCAHTAAYSFSPFIFGYWIWQVSLPDELSAICCSSGRSANALARVPMRFSSSKRGMNSNRFCWAHEVSTIYGSFRTDFNDINQQVIVSSVCCIVKTNLQSTPVLAVL